MSEQLRFHHLGLASRDVEAESKVLATLGYRPEGPAFSDPLQGISGRFMVGSGPRVEVLMPGEGSKVLDPWLNKGIKYYHCAFEVADLEAEISRQKAAGAVVVTPPMPAVAFQGRRISFLMLPNMLLIELIES